MNKKLISILSSIVVVFGVSGCANNKQIKSETISNSYVQAKDEDVKVVEWTYNEKDQSKNNTTFMGDVTMGAKDNLSQKAVNINLKKGQSLKIETKTDYPITVILKDNSNEEYLFNKTSKPVDGAILVDAVKKDGQYELMVDFNEIDEFTFSVYIVE